MSHRVEYVTQADGQYRAFCSCRLGSPLFGSRLEVEDWAYRHLDLARRARAHLRDRSPSIKDQYTYYTERAADPLESPENRRLWALLADGLRSRLPGPVENDEPLDMEVKYTPRHRPTTRDDP